jgi:hypothetical protein
MISIPVLSNINTLSNPKMKMETAEKHEVHLAQLP